MTMASSSVRELFKHKGHDLGLEFYGGDTIDTAHAAGLECHTCHEVLLNFHEVMDALDRNGNPMLEIGEKTDETP